MVAIQNIKNGQLIDIFPDKESAKKILESHKGLEAISLTPKITKVEVVYTELASPNSYGCSCPEFTSYGSARRVAINLVKFVQNSCKVFGPNYLEVRDYLTNCRVYINGSNKTSEWLKYVDRVLKDKPIFI